MIKNTFQYYLISCKKFDFLLKIVSVTHPTCEWPTIRALNTFSFTGNCFSLMNSKIFVAPSISPSWQYCDINRW